MILVGKALLLLLLEFIIEYLFGTMLIKLILKRECNPGMSLLVGFMAHQAVFQILSIIITVSTGVFQHLTIIWGIVFLVIVLLSVIISKNIAIKQCKQMVLFAKTYKWWIALSVMVVFAFCYYVSINGEHNEDAQYYIGLMTTTIQTDSLFKYNVYNGLEMESLYLRRALATFEIHGAVLSQIFGIHPLVTARVFRACQNVIWTSIAVMLCANTVFWRKEKNCVERSILTIVVFWMLQIPFANTIYKPATFLLYRAYEAKAFTANFVVLTGVYLCIKTLREKDIRYLVLIGIFLWGSIALSMSAFVVAFVTCGLLLVPVWFCQFIRRQEKLHAGQ